MNSPLRQALILLLAALIPFGLSAAFHPLRPSWSELKLAPGETDLSTALEWKEGVLWVDARSEQEFNTAHVPGAVPLNLDNWDKLFPQFLDQWSADKKVVVYCGVASCDLSTEVAERLRKNNIPSVFVLKGGWEAWKSGH
jgi:rhodanese-related sulfurtransferase